MFDLVVPRGRTSRPWPTGCGAPRRPGSDAYEALRVEARRPRFGVDSDHRTIPNELPWLRTAVHLDKGCYRGQETVARVHNLGRPPRRLVLLHLDGVSEVLAEPGTPVLAGTREVGRVGSVVRHYELGVIALALVKQSVAVDAALTVAGSTAAIDPDDAPRGRRRHPGGGPGAGARGPVCDDRPVTSGTLITVAPTGAESAKADVPALPVTVEEVAATARDCQAVGAAVIHLHVRDAETRPTLDLGRVREVVAAVRESTDLVVQLSTGGAVTDPFDARLAVLDAEPDAASLTLGTVNFGRDVFSNPWDLIVELHTQMQQRGIVPEYEVFDLGQLATLTRLLDRYGPPHGGHVHVDLVMGVPGGMPGTAQALTACLPFLPARRHVRRDRASAGRRCR